MNQDDKKSGRDRRQPVECAISAATGVLWTPAGGAPKSALLSEAQSAEAGFSLLPISKRHVGFDKPADPSAIGEAIVATPSRPAYKNHTGDLWTHLSIRSVACHTGGKPLAIANPYMKGEVIVAP